MRTLVAKVSLRKSIYFSKHKAVRALPRRGVYWLAHKGGKSVSPFLSSSTPPFPFSSYIYSSQKPIASLSLLLLYYTALFRFAPPAFATYSTIRCLYLPQMRRRGRESHGFFSFPNSILLAKLPLYDFFIYEFFEPGRKK